MNKGTNKHELKLIHQEKKQIEQRLKTMSSQDSGYLDLKRTHKELGIKESVVLEQQEQKSPKRSFFMDDEFKYLFLMPLFVVGSSAIVLVLVLFTFLSKGF